MTDNHPPIRSRYVELARVNEGWQVQTFHPTEPLTAIGANPIDALLEFIDTVLEEQYVCPPSDRLTK